MVHFVGAGPGAPDLITVRGQALLKEADIIIYAGSLVNKELLEAAPSHCRIYNSALMTLEEVVDVMIQGEKEEKKIVRLHTGDPCLYGAIREQMDALDEKKSHIRSISVIYGKPIPYEEYGKIKQEELLTRLHDEIQRNVYAR